MKSIFEANPSEIIIKSSEELKKIDQIKPPKWSMYVKTGVHRERPPVDSDWWYVRCAAVLKSVQKLGPIGVSKLRTKYGGRKNRGVAADKSYKGSGKIVRLALQQLESAGFVKQDQKGMHKGRIITPKGISFLQNISSKLVVPQKKEEKSIPKKEDKISKPKVEVKEEKAPGKEKKETKQKPTPKKKEKSPKKEKKPKKDSKK